MKFFDVVTVGNAIVDLFLGIHDANVSCRINKEACELCVRFGEKIELDRLDRCVGGNATNAAVGMARLGLQASLVAEVGDDEFANLIIKTLTKEVVDTSNIIRTQGAASSMTVGINFQQERTLFVEHVKRKHDFVFDTIGTKWIYLTSLGNEWKTAYERVVAYTLKNNIKLAFNPGTIQIEAGYDAIVEVLKQAHILFVNKEEAAKIAFSGQRLASSYKIAELLLALQEIGPKIVVITDGKEGSYSVDEQGNIFFLGLFEASVVERTGAGDAYASGFLSAIAHAKSVPEAMRCGTANAAGVITQIGAQAGLLRQQEMQQILSQYENIVATTTF